MNLAIRRSGQGPDLVLIHGWAMHGGIFATLVARLEPHFRLHVVDLPGHGDSHDFSAGALDPARVAQAIAADTPPAIWLGWSLGGLVALRAALDHPAQVRGLIEIAASPCFVRQPDWPHGVPGTIFREFGDALVTAFRPAIERFLALETLGSEHSQAELRELREHVYERGEPQAEALHEGLAILDRCDARAEIATLDCPNLWIAGRRDRLVPPAAMHWSSQQSPLGHYLELAAGHAPFLGHADAVSEAIATLAGVRLAP